MYMLDYSHPSFFFFHSLSIASSSLCFNIFLHAYDATFHRRCTVSSDYDSQEIFFFFTYFPRTGIFDTRCLWSGLFSFIFFPLAQIDWILLKNYILTISRVRIHRILPRTIAIKLSLLSFGIRIDNYLKTYEITLIV